jgi:hypothetical protein
VTSHPETQDTTTSGLVAAKFNSRALRLPRNHRQCIAISVTDIGVTLLLKVGVRSFSSPPFPCCKRKSGGTRTPVGYAYGYRMHTRHQKNCRKTLISIQGSVGFHLTVTQSTTHKKMDVPNLTDVRSQILLH